MNDPRVFQERRRETRIRERSSVQKCMTRFIYESHDVVEIQNRIINTEKGGWIGGKKIKMIRRVNGNRGFFRCCIPEEGHRLYVIYVTE